MRARSTSGFVLKAPHKYRAKATVIDGIRFASQKEARRYKELKLLEKSGEIRGLRLQEKFPLGVTQVGTTDYVKVGTYIADFVYYEMTAKPRRVLGLVVEDVKGFKTPLYRWKKKHVEAQYGITIREV